MNTARNFFEKEANPKSKEKKKKIYEALLAKNQAALDGKDIEGTLGIETYTKAVTEQLGPELDAGRGVIAGLYQHWTRLYGVDADGIKVQDPGGFDRTEVRISWPEARAMGYFWTNLIIS
jgi:hypothetical protein